MDYNLSNFMNRIPMAVINDHQPLIDGNIIQGKVNRRTLIRRRIFFVSRRDLQHIQKIRKVITQIPVADHFAIRPLNIQPFQHQRPIAQ